MLSPNKILQNRYRVVRLLGQGGMGAVYEAIDQRVSCVVALKETLVGKNSEARRAFEREAALLANLRHPVLPKVMDYFSEDDGEFLVMEFIPGYDLAELMEIRGGPFPEQHVLKWAEELLKLLEFLHSKQPPILHRDIKPSNLKVTRDGEVFLLDFGLAKGATGQMSTIEGSKSVVGYTPVYASLEQIHGRGTDTRSDIYSLGATLYHLLTAEAPIDAPTRFAAIDEEGPDPLPAVSLVNPNVSHSLSDAIARAMAMTRRQRFTSAAEMRKALGEARREEADAHAAKEVTTAKFGEVQERLAAKPGATYAAEAVRATPPVKTITVKPDLVRPGTDPIQPTATVAAHEDRKPARRFAPAIAIALLILISITVIGIVFWPGSRGADPNTLVNAPATATNEPAAKNLPVAPAGMVYVPGGEFDMGRDGGDEYERPAHQVSVKAFFLDRYEVTNEEYLKFVKATNHRAPSVWANGTYPAGAERQPVTGVIWDDAVAYCRWANKRLPTEEEWEFAARGTDGRRYPWGNDWKSDLANASSAKSGVASVGSFKGASPFGAFDMVGNVWEWTSSPLTAYPGGRLPTKPAEATRVIRGGSYDSTRENATTTYRGWLARATAKSYDQTGFRCVKDLN